MKIEVSVKFNSLETDTFETLLRWTQADCVTPPTPDVPFTAIVNGSYLTKDKVKTLRDYVVRMRCEIWNDLEFWKKAEFKKSDMIANAEVVKTSLIQAREQAVELCDEAIQLLSRADMMLPIYNQDQYSDPELD